MTRASIIALALALAALPWGCGDDGPSLAAVDLAQSTEGRVVVAEVNGQPVFDDCVVAQAQAHGLDVRDALAACIDFELLAQEARARGYASAPEVHEARKAEAVRALLEHGFEATHASPDDIPAGRIEQMWQAPIVYQRFNHPERRAALYARAELPKKTSDDSDRSRQARDVMQRFYASLRSRELTRDEFAEAARELRRDRPEGVKIDLLVDKPYSAALDGRTDKAFANALFALDEPGTVTPPTRTPWGWDVIYYHDRLPARETTLAEAAPEIREAVFPRWRKQMFLEWSARLAEGRRIEIDEARLQALANAPDDPLAMP